MTNKEISVEFDILYNNISSGAAPNLNEYEKSLFLTRAQRELVQMYYSGKNSAYNSFESDEEVRRYLDTLISVQDFQLDNAEQYGNFEWYKINKPNDLLYVVRETAQNASEGCLNGFLMQVIPITHEDLNRVLNDPFKRPNERKVLRYDTSELGNVCFNLLSGSNLSKYSVTYVRVPQPIILVNLLVYGGSEDNPEYTIEGIYEETSSDAPDTLQHKIISRAVELAKSSYVGDLNTTFAVNARDL